MSLGRICCLGDVMVDVLALLPRPLATGSDVPAPISFTDGGSAANTAAWLASLGADSVFIGRVGDDPFGERAVQALRELGVTTRVSIDPIAPTGMCLVLVSPDGERTMVPSAGANATLTVAELAAPALLRDGDRLHLSSYALLAEGSRDAARFALSEAVRTRTPISVDAASAAPIRALGGTVLLDWLPTGTLLLANSDELAALTDDASDGAAALLARGLTVVVKLGGGGAALVTPDGQQVIAAEPVPVRDSTGAGDAFAAGLLAALQTGADLVDAIGAGNRAGALAVAGLGGRPR